MRPRQKYLNWKIKAKHQLSLQKKLEGFCIKLTKGTECFLILFSSTLTPFNSLGKSSAIPTELNSTGACVIRHDYILSSFPLAFLTTFPIKLQRTKVRLRKVERNFEYLWMRDLYPTISVQPTEILRQTTLQGWKFLAWTAGYSGMAEYGILTFNLCAFN